MSKCLFYPNSFIINYLYGVFYSDLEAKSCRREFLQKNKQKKKKIVDNKENYRIIKEKKRKEYCDESIQSICAPHT